MVGQILQRGGPDAAPCLEWEIGGQLARGGEANAAHDAGAADGFGGDVVLAQGGLGLGGGEQSELAL